jgi:hypothetical protein
VERLGLVATEAKEDADKCDRAVQTAQRRNEQALADEDAVATEVNLTAMANLRSRAEAARTRLNAALDALNAHPEPNEGDVLARVWEALSGRMADADGHVPKLNAALREWFEAFSLRQMKYTGLRVVPVISADALLWMTATPPAFSEGTVSAVACGSDGEATHYWGGPLSNTGYSAAPGSRSAHSAWAR